MVVTRAPWPGRHREARSLHLEGDACPAPSAIAQCRRQALCASGSGARFATSLSLARSSWTSIHATSMPIRLALKISGWSLHASRQGPRLGTCGISVPHRRGDSPRGSASVYALATIIVDVRCASLTMTAADAQSAPRTAPTTGRTSATPSRMTAQCVDLPSIPDPSTIDDNTPTPPDLPELARGSTIVCRTQ